MEKIQNERLKKAFNRAKKIPFLRKKLKEANIDTISGVGDLQRLPFTTKKDLAECFPFGALAVPLQRVLRIHTSSGTTNKPITTFYTKRDLRIWSELMARGLACAGARKGDVFQNTTSQGLFTGGLGLIQGAERLGLTVVPLGSANAEKQLETMRDFGVTVFHAIPSFALRLMECLESQNGLRSSLKIRIGVLGAEPWTKEMRKKIEEGLEIDAFNNYGLAEVGGPGVAIECQSKSGLHVWEDHFLAEIIDPKTGEQLGLEEEGELVITPLSREAMPLLRFRTGDITRFIDGPCECGRTHRKIDWMRGRIDDMIKVRGIGIYPSTIERIVASHKESNGNFLILLSGIDDITVKVEVNNGFAKDQAVMERLRHEIFEEIKGATLLRTNVEVLPPGSIPRSEGKAKRVLDTRRLV
ncbi:MAG: phenylacetate--CoA ligase [Candidatus Verstraetearchaeota archaeon]|nr:phenylacetate--CoA ligase [Candidatus Methanomethylicia archaeon]NHV59861.1 phenylacetate--CoA ligase [Candidatus Verstraetearchaeota archaeon]